MTNDPIATTMKLHAIVQEFARRGVSTTIRSPAAPERRLFEPVPEEVFDDAQRAILEERISQREQPLVLSMDTFRDE